MENSINLSILLPLFPLGMTFFLFILLRSFNRTVNRLTKPISYLTIISILGSTGISFFLLVNHIEGNILFSDYLNLFKGSNFELYINELIEKIIIICGLTSTSLIGFSVLNLPRKRGYVLYILNIGLITSLIISALLVIKF